MAKKHARKKVTRKAGARSRSRNRARSGASGRATQRQKERNAGAALWEGFVSRARELRTASSTGGSMARKRKRRSRSRAVVRRSSARGASSTVARPRRRSRARSFVARFRPTRGGLRSVVPFTMNATIGAAEVMGGVIIARKARGFAKLAPGTPFAMVAEFAAGIVAGMIVSRFNAQAGERVAIGGVLAPMMTAVQRLSIPHVSDALGDDGYVLDGGLTLDDASGVAGYVAGANAGGIAGYVPGRDWASA